MHISAEALIPVLKIHLIMGFRDAKKAVYYMTGEIISIRAQGDACACFQEPVETKQTDCTAKQNRKEPVEGHHDGFDKQKRLPDADGKQQETGKDPSQCERKQEPYLCFCQQDGNEQQGLPHQNADTGGRHPESSAGIDTAGEQEQAYGHKTCGEEYR